MTRASIWLANYYNIYPFQHEPELSRCRPPPPQSNESANALPLSGLAFGRPSASSWFLHHCCKSKLRNVMRCLYIAACAFRTTSSSILRDVTFRSFYVSMRERRSKNTRSVDGRAHLASILFYWTSRILSCYFLTSIVHAA